VTEHKLTDKGRILSAIYVLERNRDPLSEKDQKTVDVAVDLLNNPNTIIAYLSCSEEKR
jgi:hypothetical protein